MTTKIVSALGARMRSLNKAFSTAKKQLFINDIVNNPELSLKDALFNILPDGGIIDPSPSCVCGHYSRRSLLDEICPKCGEVCMYRTEKSLEPIFHIPKPIGVSTFINPWVYMVLVRYCNIGKMGKNSFNPIFYLTDSNYKPIKEDNKQYLNIQTWDVERSWSYFANNFRDLAKQCMDLKLKALGETRPDKEYLGLLEVLSYPDDLLFCDVIPIINKLLMNVEQMGDIVRKAPTTENYAIAIADAIKLPYLPDSPEALKVANDTRYYRRTNNIVGRMYRDLNHYFDETIKREGKKGGLCRSDALGLRSPFTWRSVIVQIQYPDRYDDIEMPYTASTYVLEPMILRVLGDERGMGPNQALEYLEARRRVYCDDLHMIMTTILFSFTDRGMPVYSIRYPTLYRHSGVLVYCPRIKKDPEDLTVGLSDLILSGMNADERLNLIS